MILRTILFFVLLYLLVKVLSRLFLPSDRQKKQRRSKSAFNIFYTTMKKNAERQRQQGNGSDSGPGSGNSSDNVKNRLDQIEEAEFEEIEDEEKEESGSSSK